MQIDLPTARLGPIFLDLAQSIITEIERGRLKPGDPLPGTRALARSLKLNRNTVDAAYHELTMQGWLEARPSRGTFVATDLPESAATAMRASALVAPSVVSATPPVLHMTDGAPDARLMPHAELARAFRTALSSSATLTEMVHGDPYGAPRLRSVLSEYLAHERGLAAPASEVMVTRGSQMGLFLSAAALIMSGDVIAVEEPGYPLAWAAFRAAGANVIGVPVDGGGIDLDRLEQIAVETPRLTAVYVTPHHQYPTTVTLGAGRRLRLLDLARRHGLTVLEDDYDNEYRFDGRPILPMAARASDDQPIVYLGSLSKLMAPALRLGYVVASPATLTRMATVREAIDRQGDLPLEQAFASLIAQGDVRRHARKARRVYQARRDLFVTLLKEHLSDIVDFDVPAGGLAIWLKMREGLSAQQWSDRALKLGLGISPGARFTLDLATPPEALRVGFASLDEQEMSEAARLLVASRPTSTGLG
ncbi:GntR family transcriptional regulator/MocR family aminotransferase [Sphingobium sp. B11D3B]|uniref:MocR-like pyridoxine biosynthesis transcription factor PdxR n=1 Tax=Sphingobium sp. B11D3B TaxID=2940575 RepID=UPI002226FEF6|nr:PLP-dependent aminotransferase family protein [Sphingobium sp. B11D3B]MCW2389638.1 GntR family transcriptional regulator/MocR family aminotransferase [Sphingobium sp. B11D3B]